MEHEVQDTMEPELEDMDFTLNLESSDTELTGIPGVTTFRALNEGEQRQTENNGKFERLDKASNDSDIDED